MASAVCQFHGEPRPGRIVGAYPRLVQNGAQRSKFVRLCIPCARDLVTAHATDWSDAAVAGTLKETTSCSSCGLVVDSNPELSRFYCTVYPDGKNRRDYAAAYCPACTTERVKEFDLGA